MSFESLSIDELAKQNWITGGQYRYAQHQFPESDLVQAPYKFVPATMDDYDTWLHGYLMQGGIGTHLKDSDEVNVWNGSTYHPALVAVEDFELQGEYGTFARDILVLPGRQCSGKVGQNRLYFLDDFSTTASAVDVFASNAGALNAGKIVEPTLLAIFQRQFVHASSTEASKDIVRTIHAMAGRLAVSFDITEVRDGILARKVYQEEERQRAIDNREARNRQRRVAHMAKQWEYAAGLREKKLRRSKNLIWEK